MSSKPRKPAVAGAQSTSSGNNNDRHTARPGVPSKETDPTLLPLRRIRRDGGTQVREGTDYQTAQSYAEVLLGGGEFPPVTVFFDGRHHWLADGFHRVEAHKVARRRYVSAVVIPGTQRDAALFAAGANGDNRPGQENGLKRSRLDVRRAVFTLLVDEEWSRWSNREIARYCDVHESLVRRARKQAQRVGHDARPRTGVERRIVRRGGRVYEMDISGQANPRNSSPERADPATGASKTLDEDRSQWARGAMFALERALEAVKHLPGTQNEQTAVLIVLQRIRTQLEHSSAPGGRETKRSPTPQSRHR
jgi:hypothetical protein